MDLTLTSGKTSGFCIEGNSSKVNNGKCMKTSGKKLSTRQGFHWGHITHSKEGQVSRFV